MVLIVGLITLGILTYRVRFKKTETDMNILTRYNRLVLYRKYGFPKRRLWVSPFTKVVSDSETYYFDKKIVPKEDF